MAMVIGAHLAYLVLSRPSWSTIRRCACSYVIAAVLVAPLVPHGSKEGTAGISWIPSTNAYEVGGIGHHIAGGWFMLAASAVAVLACAFLAWKHRRTAEAHRWMLLVLGSAVPVIGGLVASVTITPVTVDRYYIECVPFIALALAAAIMQLPRPAFSAVAAITVGGFAIAGLVSWYDKPSFQDWRGATGYLAATASSRPQIINALPGQALQYYLERDQPAIAAHVETSPQQCFSEAPPACVGEADEVELITSSQAKQLSAADVTALRNAGYAASTTHTFAGPIVVTLYRHPGA
jgi:hypothetical protein